MRRLINEEEEWYKKEGILLPDFTFISNDDIVGKLCNIVSLL